MTAARRIELILSRGRLQEASVQHTPPKRAPIRPSTYVLVGPGWPAWAWSRLAGRLTELGNRVHIPTSTGLLEGAPLQKGRGLEAHVDDVVGEILWEDLDQLVVVGHSTAQILIAGVAAKMADRIASIIYIDAFIPEDEKFFADVADWIDQSCPMSSAAQSLD